MSDLSEVVHVRVSRPGFKSRGLTPEHLTFSIRLSSRYEANRYGIAPALEGWY